MQCSLCTTDGDQSGRARGSEKERGATRTVHCEKTVLADSKKEVKSRNKVKRDTSGSHQKHHKARDERGIGSHRKPESMLIVVPQAHTQQCGSLGRDTGTVQQRVESADAGSERDRLLARCRPAPSRRACQASHRVKWWWSIAHWSLSVGCRVSG